MVAGLFHIFGQAQQDRNRWKENRCRLARHARAHEAADGLGEKERGRCRGSIDAHRKARDVDALRYHADRHHPLIGGLRKFLNAVRRTGIIRQNHRHWRIRKLFEDLGIRACGRRIRSQHEAAGIRHIASHLHQAGMRRLQHRRNPLALGVQSGAPRSGGLLRIHNVAQTGCMFLTGRIAPAGFARVRKKDNGAHDAVGKRIAIAIGMVRAGYLVPLPIVHVLDEWNGRVVGAERRTGQSQAVIDIVISFLDAIAPALSVAGMVDLIQNHQRAPSRGNRAVLKGMHAHLRIGHHNAVHRRIDGGGIAKRRI